MLTRTVSQAIGQTPMIKIKSLSEMSGCEIFGKAEFLNTGGSVKDRTALGIIEQAEKDGLLKPGFTRLPHKKVIVVPSSCRTIRPKKNTNKRIFTMLCDSATRYQSKIFNPVFLTEKSLLPQAIS